MTTNKPGNVNQRPLYGCTGCYEDYSWPAGDLRVHDGECWCFLCWDGRWESDQPIWIDLEPYTPALQAENQALRRGVAGLAEAITSALDGPLLDYLGNRGEGGLRAYPDMAWVKKTLQDALASYPGDKT